MCGITGYFSLEKKITEVELEQMTSALSHRGPDAAGYFFSDDKSVALGHRRLSIIDLSTAANQPMHSHNNRYVVVFNGEIYNFKDIVRDLDIHQRTSGDTEVILEAFMRKGPACVQLFNGMFSIAIFDKHDQTLYLFRDRLGVKPLYYYHQNNVLAFASEMKALMQLQEVRSQARVFKPAVRTFLYAGYVPEPYTIYNCVRRFPAGSYGVYKNNKLEIIPYWQPQDKITAATQTDFTTAKAQLKALLESSVKYRMISDVPFGTFLSGGIDSSTVTAIAQAVSDKPVKTFSIGFKEAKHNESEYARLVSGHLGTQHYQFTVTEQDALGLIDKMMTAYDEPYADSSAIPTMLVSKLARQYVTMTLSGDGGDELFMGYGAYQWARRLNNPLLKLLRKPIALALRQTNDRNKRAAGVIDYTDETRIKSHIFSQEQYFFSEPELDALLTPAYSSDLLFNEKSGNLKRKLSVEEEQALFDLKYYLKDDLLVKVDIASMQYSLENRTPFLDYRVVEFALNLSQNLKLKEGTAKYLLKEVLYDYVPRALFQRPKWGFSIPLAKWLKTDLHYLIDRYLSPALLQKHGIVSPDKVKDLIHKFESGSSYLYNRLWALILLHKWMEEHA